LRSNVESPDVSDFIYAIDWSDSTVVAALITFGGAVVVALIGGFFMLRAARKKQSNQANAPQVQQTVTQNASPTTNVQASPKQHQTQTVKIGVDEEGVGRVIEAKYAPIEAELAALREDFGSIRAQLVGKVEPPDTTDPRKLLAAEFFNEGVGIYETGDVPGAMR